MCPPRQDRWGQGPWKHTCSTLSKRIEKRKDVRHVPGLPLETTKWVGPWGTYNKRIKKKKNLLLASPVFGLVNVLKSTVFKSTCCGHMSHLSAKHIQRLAFITSLIGYPTKPKYPPLARARDPLTLMDFNSDLGGSLRDGLVGARIQARGQIGLAHIVIELECRSNSELAYWCVRVLPNSSLASRAIHLPTTLPPRVFAPFTVACPSSSTKVVGSFCHLPNATRILTPNVPVFS